MEATRYLLLLGVLILLSYELLSVKGQNSLLDTINTELADLKITLPLNDRTINIPGQVGFDPTTVILKEVVCSSFGLGGVVLKGEEDGTQVFDATTFERYVINAGALDITVQCTVDITTKSCGRVRNNGKITIAATDLDVLTETTLLSEDYAAKGPVVSLPDSRPCSQIIDLQLSSPVYTDITVDTFACFLQIPINGIFANIMNTLVVNPLLRQVSDQLCEPIREATAPLGDLFLAARGAVSKTVSSITEVAVTTEVAKLGGDFVFDAPTDATVEAFDAVKTEKYLDDIVEDARAIVDDALANLDEGAEADPNLAAFLATARAVLKQLQITGIDLSRISLQEILDLASRPGATISTILEAITGNSALVAQLEELIDSAINTLDLSNTSISDLLPRIPNSSGEAGGANSSANATAQSVDTLGGFLTRDIRASDLIELISSLTPGNSNFGLEEFAEEIDTVIGLLNGRTTGSELIALIAKPIPGNATFGFDLTVAANIIDRILNGTSPDNIELLALFQGFLEDLLPDLVKIPVPGFGEVGVGVKVSNLNFSFPSTGQWEPAGQTSLVLPSLSFSQSTIDLVITVFLNISLIVPPLVDVGPIIFQDNIQTSLTVGEWAVAVSALFGFDYTTLLEASKVGLNKPVAFAGCSASGVYAMLSGVFFNLSLVNAEVAASDALLSTLLESINIINDLYGPSLPTILQGALYNATSVLSNQDIKGLLPRQGSCEALGITPGGRTGDATGDNSGDALFVAAPIALVGILATVIIGLRGRTSAAAVVDEVKPLENNTTNPVHPVALEESQGSISTTKVVLAKEL